MDFDGQTVHFFLSLTLIQITAGRATHYITAFFALVESRRRQRLCGEWRDDSCDDDDIKKGDDFFGFSVRVAFRAPALLLFAFLLLVLVCLHR